jgi:hypothetical protein
MPCPRVFALIRNCLAIANTTTGTSRKPKTGLDLAEPHDAAEPQLVRWMNTARIPPRSNTLAIPVFCLTDWKMREFLIA